MSASIYDFSARDLSGKERSLGDYRGQVILIVNTASKCGFTPQYGGLETLHQTYQGRGLRVLGFPCNQFGRQEPGSGDEIQSFCQVNYGVTFQLFEKIEVNGKGAHPLYKFLKDQARGVLGSSSIKWNFTKFLVNRDGKVVGRFAPKATPAELAEQVEALL